jgi:hypothetical protein
MGESMPPNAYNLPTFGAKKPDVLAVPCGSAADFGLPVLAVVMGHAAVPAAAVPETPINENCEAGSAEDKVRAPMERLVAAPAGDASAAEHRGKL